MPDTYERRAVGVLGMHRSGTSAVTRALNLMGISLGPEDHLMPATSDNAEGYWENTQLVYWAEQLLLYLGRTWDTSRRLPNGWLDLPETNKYVDALSEIVQTEFDGVNLWAWKDPRSCLLVPAWRKLAKRIRLDLSYVIVFRNPLDVAASLNKRDGIRYEHGLDMWTLYTGMALSETRGARRVVISYEEFLEDWRTSLRRVSDALSLQWPTDEGFEPAMDLAIKPSLRHNKSQTDAVSSDNRVSATTRELYALCQEAIENPGQLGMEDFESRVETALGEFRPSASMAEGADINGKLRIFWPSAGQYSEANSLATNVIADADFHEYAIELPVNVEGPIRIDPDDWVSAITVRRIELAYGDVADARQVWSSDNSFEGLTLSGNTLPWDSPPDFGVLGIDSDPQVVLANQSVTVPDAFPTIRIVMSVMRFPTVLAVPVASAFKQYVSEQNLAFPQRDSELSELRSDFSRLQSELQTTHNSRLWRYAIRSVTLLRRLIHAIRR